MIQFSILPKSTPMWVGWNTQHRIEKKATEKIWYLPAINQSSTSTAVVKETMKKAQQLAVECGKCEIALTYDLTIAKMAMEIQIEESPTSDNIFVTLGSFHMEMAFFSVIGKYIFESGGPHLLTESGIIENGSLISFLLATREVNVFINCLQWQWKSHISIPSSYLCKKMILRNSSH